MDFFNLQYICYWYRDLVLTTVRRSQSYFDIVAHVASLENDFLEWLDPLSRRGMRVGTEMVDSICSTEGETLMFLIPVIHFYVDGIAEVDSSAGEI